MGVRCSPPKKLSSSRGKRRSRADPGTQRRAPARPCRERRWSCEGEVASAPLRHRWVPVFATRPRDDESGGNARCLPKIPLSSLPKPQPDQHLGQIRTRISRPGPRACQTLPRPVARGARSAGDPQRRRERMERAQPGARPRGVACRGDARSSRVEGRTAEGAGRIPAPVQEMVAAIPARRVQKDPSSTARPMVRACGNPSARSV